MQEIYERLDQISADAEEEDDSPAAQLIVGIINNFLPVLKQYAAAKLQVPGDDAGISGSLAETIAGAVAGSDGEGS